MRKKLWFCFPTADLSPMETCGKSPEETGPLQAQQGCSLARPAAAPCTRNCGRRALEAGWGAAAQGSPGETQCYLRQSRLWVLKGGRLQALIRVAFKEGPGCPWGQEEHRAPITSKIRWAACVQEALSPPDVTLTPGRGRRHSRPILKRKGREGSRSLPLTLS